MGTTDFRDSGQGDAAGRPRPWLRMATSERLVTLVRRGDRDAFDALYDRHAGELLGFCRSILRSTHDAEDALQSTFAAAYRSLAADDRELAVRPWLFTIARNTCLSTLRQRRVNPPLGEPAAPASDPLESIERDEEFRELLECVRELPERQRSAIVLAELHGLSHREIASVLAVEPAQVKSYVFQARAKLAAEREARGADCLEIRHQLDAARGSALLRTRLRRHLGSCAACREYANALTARRRQGLGAWAPLAPLLALRRRALGWWPWGDPSPSCGAAESAGAGVSVTAGVEVASGGAKLLIAKLATGLALAGAGAGVGTGMITGIGVTGPAFLGGAGASRPTRAAQAAQATVVGAAAAERRALMVSAGGAPRLDVGAGGHGSNGSPALPGLKSAGPGGDAAGGGASSPPATGIAASEGSSGREQGMAAEAPGRTRGERGEAPGRPSGTGEAPSSPPGQDGGSPPGQAGSGHTPEPPGQEAAEDPPHVTNGQAEAGQATTGHAGEAASRGEHETAGLGAPASDHGAAGERGGAGGEHKPAGDHGPAGGERGRH